MRLSYLHVLGTTFYMITRIFVQQVYLIYSNDAVFLLLKLNVWFVLQFCFKVFYFKTSKSVYNFSYHLI